jgi:hypothetical protein
MAQVTMVQMLFTLVTVNKNNTYNLSLHNVTIRTVLPLFEFIIRKKFNLTLSADISFTLILYTNAVLSSDILILLSLLANITTHICLTTTCGLPAANWLLVCSSTTCKSLRLFGSQLIQRILRAFKYT